MMYGNKLKELRVSNDLTQDEVANILNIERGTYSQYETEYIIMPLKHLNTLGNYFNVSIDFLFDFNNVRQYKNSNKDINNNTSGLRIKEFRKDNNLTQVKLAEILNTVHPTIVNYENGKNLINTPFLYEICSKYKISADYLLGKIDEPKYLN